MARKDDQLQLPLQPRLRVIQGEGQARREPLDSRDAVARILIEAGADLLLRRISPERAEAIEHLVEDALALFDKSERSPEYLELLEQRLAELESLVRQTQDLKAQGRPQRRRS